MPPFSLTIPPNNFIRYTANSWQSELFHPFFCFSPCFSVFPGSTPRCMMLVYWANWSAPCQMEFLTCFVPLTLPSCLWYSLHYPSKALHGSFFDHTQTWMPALKTGSFALVFVFVRSPATACTFKPKYFPRNRQTIAFSPFVFFCVCWGWQA